MAKRNEKNLGLVCLVGAGPGDPGLITVRGLELLRRADVVVYDALVNPRLLAEAPDQAEIVDVGKRAADHKLSQEQINQLLVEKARAGVLVVRLKGGDPYLFGRGAEEATYLGRHGVACEVVPGVTAGAAAPAAAGIPLTHRKIASTVTFVTGHEDPAKPQTSVDYRALAALAQKGGTLCFYMGAGRLEEIVRLLQDQGLAAETPLAAIQWGTLPRQKSVTTTLAKAVADVDSAGIGAPAIILVGKVAAISEPGLDYFTRRPLFGVRIIITRTRRQASDLRRRLEELGAEVLEAPTIELVKPDDWSPIDQAIRDVKSYDWLIFTSVNGVSAVADRMTKLHLDARHLESVKLAAIGAATKQALRAQLGVTADLVPARFVAESLAGELIARGDIVGKRILLLRADIARPALRHLLSEAGAHVTDLTVYHTKLAHSLPQNVLTALRQNEVDWITFTSSSTAANMVQLLGRQRSLLHKVKIASIGPITSQTIRRLGLQVDLEAQRSDIGGLVDALVTEGR